MDSQNEKTLRELIHSYRTKFPNDAKLLREAVEDGNASSIYPTLLEKLAPPFKLTSEKLFHSARYFYFLGYCLNYNNGIPIIEIFNNTIDTSKKDKVINAVKSQKTLIDFLVSKGVDKADLEEYVAEKETIEYSIDENNKSTGVLKRILARKQITAKETIQTDSFGIKDKMTEADKYEQSTRVFEEQKSPTEKATKYESEFFKITESICYEFNEDMDLTYDTFNDELFLNIDKFKAEINENITNLNQSDRGFYLKRILKRLKKSIGTTIHKNKETGDEYALKTDASIDRVHTFEGDELERYYRMSNIYKNQMIDFISQLIEPATKTEIMGFIENELNISSPYKIPINKDGFPVDEKGNFMHSIDDKGNCIIRLVNHENIVFSATDKQQVHKAAKQIAEYLSKNFSLNLENELLISVKTEKVYTVEPARLPTVGIYFDSINKTLNYLESVCNI